MISIIDIVYYIINLLSSTTIDTGKKYWKIVEFYCIIIRKNVEVIKMKKNISKILIVIAICLFVSGSIFVTKGFDKKNNYYYSEDKPELNVNVYVGADAYNFIINSNYFTGYLVLGSTLLLMGTIICIAGVYLSVNYQLNEIKSDELPPL